jgi:hypothetical protein
MFDFVAVGDLTIELGQLAVLRRRSSTFKMWNRAASVKPMSTRERKAATIAPHSFGEAGSSRSLGRTKKPDHWSGFSERQTERPR